MIAPRWRKVLRDLEARPGRSLLAALAMAAGVFEIGTLLVAYAVLDPVLRTMYDKTRPAAAVIATDDAGDALVDSVRRVPGVGDAEARPVLNVRMRSGPDEWKPSVLYVVRAFDRQRMDRFRPERGAWPPGPDDVLLERSALAVAGVKIGDRVTVRAPGGGERTLRVAGTVHAPGLPPAWMEHMVPGFVGWDSSLRGAGETEEIHVAVADHALDEGHVREVADSVRAMLERQGHAVTRTTVPTPGRHPHADQMDAFLFLLSTFGILSFLLGAALAASMVHGLLLEQVREIGIMKALGATTRQIAGLYLGQIAILASISLVLGVPLGVLAGRAYARFSAGILNADVTHEPFPWWAVGVVIAVGLAAPLALAMAPILSTARITAREALSDDPGSRPFGSRPIERWLGRLGGLPRPFMLTLRTALIRRGRLALTVGMLAAGGAVFMSAMNVSAAWTRAVERDFARRRYDLTVVLASATPIERVAARIAARPEVARAEYWTDASGYLIGRDGVPGGTVSLIGMQPGSRLLELAVRSGRWLEPGDANAAVVNAAVVKRNPALGVGGTVQVRIKGKNAAFPIVGVAREISPLPALYTSSAAVLAATGRDPGQARVIRVVTRGHDDAAQRTAARAIERELRVAGIEVSGMYRMLDMKRSILDHLVIIMTLLTAASLIVVIVGALGLMSTMTVNVVQRTREIGILGAIGATPATIAFHIWIESLAVALASAVLAVLLAIPISAGIGATVGGIFFKAPLELSLSGRGIALWFLVVVVVASLASIYPAARAARLSVREALAHA